MYRVSRNVSYHVWIKTIIIINILPDDRFTLFVLSLYMYQSKWHRSQTILLHWAIYCAYFVMFYQYLLANFRESIYSCSLEMRCHGIIWLKIENYSVETIKFEMRNLFGIILYWFLLFIVAIASLFYRFLFVFSMKLKLSIMKFVDDLSMEHGHWTLFRIHAVELYTKYCFCCQIIFHSVDIKGLIKFQWNVSESVYLVNWTQFIFLSILFCSMVGAAENWTSRSLF